MLYVSIILKKVGEILLFYSSYETDDILQRILSKYVKTKKIPFLLSFSSVSVVSNSLLSKQSWGQGRDLGL